MFWDHYPIYNIIYTMANPHPKPRQPNSGLKRWPVGLIRARRQRQILKIRTKSYNKVYDIIVNSISVGAIFNSDNTLILHPPGIVLSPEVLKTIEPSQWYLLPMNLELQALVLEVMGNLERLEQYWATNDPATISRSRRVFKKPPAAI